MEITIKASPKEIAELLMEVEAQLENYSVTPKPIGRRGCSGFFCGTAVNKRFSCEVC